MKLTASPLTPESFCRFGQVLMADRGVPEYISWLGRLENFRPEARLNITYMSLEPVDYPVHVTEIERHPFSHQMFVPLESTCHLVVVCPSLADGSPDIERAQAFQAAGGQTVIYTANIWHAPRTILKDAGSFIMMRWDNGTKEDTELIQLPLALEVEAFGK